VFEIYIAKKNVIAQPGSISRRVRIKDVETVIFFNYYIMLLSYLFCDYIHTYIHIYILNVLHEPTNVRM